MQKYAVVGKCVQNFYKFARVHQNIKKCARVWKILHNDASVKKGISMHD